MPGRLRMFTCEDVLWNMLWPCVWGFDDVVYADEYDGMKENIYVTINEKILIYIICRSVNLMELKYNSFYAMLAFGKLLKIKEFKLFFFLYHRKKETKERKKSDCGSSIKSL